MIFDEPKGVLKSNHKVATFISVQENVESDGVTDENRVPQDFPFALGVTARSKTADSHEMIVWCFNPEERAIWAKCFLKHSKP